MSSLVEQLSALKSPPLSSNMVGIGFKQFQRSYPGGFSMNFSSCLSGSSDFKVKNYTNFYLTTDQKFGDCFEVSAETLKANSITTPIQYGNSYLQFVSNPPPLSATVDRFANQFDYRGCKFTSVSSKDTIFTIKLLPDNVCHIIFTENFKKYYLSTDSINDLAFVRDSRLTFDTNTTNSQDFRYIFSEDAKYLFLFQNKVGGQYFVSKVGSKLKLTLLTADNILDTINNPFKLARNFYTRPNISFDTSFITYDGKNNINDTKSLFNLTNNFLLHRKYSEDASKTDIIVLKNQLLQENVFSSANSLLSSQESDIFVNGLREYSRISEDIQEEENDTLELNYVFYNKSYVIKPGSNIFTSPSSVAPFNQLNINDSKFVASGAFSYPTPDYADKVYHLSNQPQNFDNGQYLLCTWLSGGPTSQEKIWVDRYYYPDLIEKEAALSGNSSFIPTYEDAIEQLIASNMQLEESINRTKFFDKRSDLVFTPNQKYEYHRISVSDFPLIKRSIHSSIPDYFTKINEKGKITFGLYFDGNLNSWEVKSDRNSVNAGIGIKKDKTDVEITINFYDPAIRNYKTFTIKKSFIPLKENFVCVSLDTFVGTGYVFLNSSVILPFLIPTAKYFKRILLYGNFFIHEGNKKIPLTEYIKTSIKGVFVLDEYIDSNIVFILPIIEGRLTIDNIYVTLPCGMRNSVDDLDYLQSICGSAAFKSNRFNIKLKNIGIDNDNILQGIRDSITTSIERVIPITSTINRIDFEDYKLSEAQE